MTSNGHPSLSNPDEYWCDVETLRGKIAEKSFIQIEEADEDVWQAAYLKKLDELCGTFDVSMIEGALLYLDDDNIPEMYFSDPYEYDIGGLYTYKDGEVIELLSCGHRVFYVGHKERSGLIVTQNPGFDTSDRTNFYTLGSDFFMSNKLLERFYTIDDGNYSGSYFIDSSEISESGYYSKLDELKEGLVRAEMVETESEMRKLIQSGKVSAVITVPRFEICEGALTWEEAKKACEDKGGHLAYVKSGGDYSDITERAFVSGKKFLWVGGTTSISGSTVTAKWLDGSDTSFLDESYCWFTGEPSGRDNSSADKILEPYMMLWYVKGNWSFNDNSNAALDAYKPETMGYVCQYD